MKLKKFSYLVIGLSLLGQAAFASNDTFTYKNTHGSELTLQLAADHSVTGSFTTAVASKDCQEAIGMKRPVIGYVEKNAISFSVSYPGCNSVVSFAGNFDNNKNILDTTAIIVHQAKHIATDGPGARMLSHDVFTRT